MAFKKTLAQRLFNITKLTNSHNSTHHCRISSPSTPVKSFISSSSSNNHDSTDDGILRKFLHRKPVDKSPENKSGLLSLPPRDKIRDRLKGLDISKSRISLDGLKPPVTVEEEEEKEEEVSVEDARKLLKLSHLEMVKSKLRMIEKNCIPYDEFVKLCSTTTSFGSGQGLEVAKILDQSGTVIVLGNVVFIRPEQVMKVINGLMTPPQQKSSFENDPRMEELQKMENKKAEIDKKAEALVRQELWCGLGFLSIQTLAFMRLTFWDLSWDVMEPICFYVTSMYFMAGYTFFLRTSKEPSFEGFFNSRFSKKQERLMKLHNFDLDRYNELQRIWNRINNTNNTSIK